MAEDGLNDGIYTATGEGWGGTMNLQVTVSGGKITLGVRPEDIVAGGSLPVLVSTNENLGMNTLVHGHMGTQQENKISAKLRGWANYKNGDTVAVQFTKMHFFDKKTTQAIRKEAK